MLRFGPFRINILGAFAKAFSPAAANDPVLIAAAGGCVQSPGGGTRGPMRAFMAHSIGAASATIRRNAMQYHVGRLVDHVHLKVHDVAASRRFYNAIFGALGLPQ